MFNFLKRKRETVGFTVQPFHGKYAIVAPGEVNGTRQILATYTRKRDAIRGADRKGILLANV